MIDDESEASINYMIDVESGTTERTVVRATVVRATVTYKNKSHFMLSNLAVVVNPTKITDRF
jgi:hypothetical protein